MLQTHFLQLLDYEKQATEAVLNTVRQVKPKKRPPKVAAIVSHLLAAQEIWLVRLQGETVSVSPWQETPETVWLPTLMENVQKLTRFILKCDNWQSTITYENSKGERFENTIAGMLQHLFLHGSYHRGQLVVLMRPWVEKPPVTDFIFYLREGNTLEQNL